MKNKIDKELKQWALISNMNALEYDKTFLFVHVSKVNKEKIKKDIMLRKKFISFIKKLETN